MDELNINDMPAEMLTEVFQYLKGGNLKNAAMVCELWNNLIESAFLWSLKLEGGWLGRHSKKKNFALTTNRKFGTIKISGARLNGDKQIVDIFKRHGFNVFELHLFGCRINKLTEFAELLKFTPNLKHVVVDIDVDQDIDTEISHGSSDELLMDQLLPDLEKLKILDIRGYDYRIIECFRNAKLRTVAIWADEPSKHRRLLADFLLTQDELTSLTLDSFYSPSTSILFEIGKLNVPIPFRLTQLSICYVDPHELEDYDHLMTFLESQAGNLTKIEMNYRISSSVYECVFANMTKLNTLSVEINMLPRDQDFYDRLEENCNVHTLRLLDSGMLDNHFVGKFLEKLPNVRSLTLKYVERNILAMAQSFCKLESLYIRTIHATSVDCVKFPNLKTLHIQHLQGKINWNTITWIHPLLTELTIVEIDNESYLTTDDIDQITTNVDLQHIRIGAGFVADNRFFEIVASKCKKLKVLDLHESCISQNLGHYLKIDVLLLRDSITCSECFHSNA